MSHRWWILASVGCGTFMATLDSSIVNIALPTMTKDMGTHLNQVKWVVIVYLLIVTCFILPFGRLSDMYGRKKIFQLGFLIFTLGSVVCGFSKGLTDLIIFRAVQAIGASMLMANGPAIIASAFPVQERGTALGTMAMVVSAGLISGPSIGGLLITHLGWRSIFIINIPIGIAGMALVYYHMPKDHSLRLKVPFDWAGSLLQSILLFLFIVIFDPPNISMSGSTPLPVSRLALLAGLAVIAAIFYKVESDAKAPLIDFSLIKNRVFWTANLASYLTFVSFSSVSVLMPFFLEEVLQYSPDTAGALMTAIPLTIFVVAPISGRLSDRFGSRELSFAGAFIGALCLFIMAGAFGLGMHKEVSQVGILLALCSTGLAIGLFQSPNNNAIMAAVPQSKLGVASAILATIRNLGLVSGTGLATGLFSWRLTTTSDYVGSLHFTHFVAGIIGAGAMLASLGKGRGFPKPHVDKFDHIENKIG
jgi:EmrB/QacA subfamily drug resistance transporter